jgi:2-succinyl-5-enolpyruvyl-6-hydroxy-3-cyclohexene-1-carboxylate synthase
VRYATISPGSRSTPIALALHRHPAIDAAVILDERSAGFFALGAAQATGVPAAVACTSGSAAANLHPAVVEADEAAVGLLILTSDRPPELRGTGAGQTIDQLKLYGASVRWFSEVGTHEADDAGLVHYRSTACRAYAAARGEPRPGPVHLNLAWRDPLGPEVRPGEVSASSRLALTGRGERPLTEVIARPTAPDPALLDELAQRVVEAPRGLILAGRQTDTSLSEPLARLARAAGYPILAEPTSQLRLGPHDRSRVVWAYDAIARAAPRHLAPDLVLRVGDMPTSKPLRGWIASLGELRQVVLDPQFGWHDASRSAETIVRADPARAFDGIADLLVGSRPAADAAVSVGRGSGATSKEGATWGRDWAEAASLAADAIRAGLAALAEPTEPGVHARLSELYGDGDLVYTASSMPIRDQEAFVPDGAARVRFLCNRGANGLDGLISSGIGAAVASGQPVWIVTGDLGLVYDSSGLAGLRYAREPVRIVVLNNGGGGIFEFLPQASEIEREEFEALLATPSGIDFELLAGVYGIPHHRVTDLGELAEVTAETGIVELPTDRHANVEVHERLSASVAEALAPLPR